MAIITYSANSSPLHLPNLKLYLSANKMAQQTDGTTVASFTDFSGNGYHANQATEANKPTFETNEFGVNAGIKFDGVNDVLTMNSSILKNTDVYTFQMVCKRNTLGTVGMFCYISTSTGVSRLNINTTSTNVSVAARVLDGESPVNVTFATNDLNPHLLQITLNAGIMYVYWDGVLRGSVTFTGSIISNTNSIACSLGANVSDVSGDNFLNCVINGVSLSYNYSDQTTIIQQYQGYLSRGYL